jgi:DNA-binding response OmpR family regulator
MTEESRQPLPAIERDTAFHAVLVVDDEPLVRGAIKAILEAQGYRVVVAPEGHAALEAFWQQNFDIALLDLGLPGMNGYQVAEQMKMLKPGVPIILVTGWGNEADRDRMARSGIHSVVPKPFGPSLLLSAIEAALGGHSSPPV